MHFSVRSLQKLDNFKLGSNPHVTSYVATSETWLDKDNEVTIITCTLYNLTEEDMKEV